MNRRAYSRLTPAQRDALRRAGRAAITPAFRRVEANEIRALARICRRGRLGLVSATAAELAALHRAVRPVYALLERDPRVRVQIATIRRMRERKTTTGAVRCGRGEPARTAAAASPLDGSWHMTVTRAELLRLGTPPDEAAAVRGSWTYTVRAGRFVIRNRDQGHVWKGRATIDDRTITIVVESCPPRFPVDCSPGETYEHRWSRYRDTVTFARAAGRTYAPIFIVKPWQR